MEEPQTTDLTHRSDSNLIIEQPGDPSHPIARIDHNGLIRVELEINRFCQGLTRAGRVRPSMVQTYQKRFRFFLQWLKRLPSDPPWTWSLDLMYAYLLDTLGWTHHKMGHQTDAVRILQQATTLVPDHPILNYHLGAAYAKGGQRAEALTYLKKALASDATFEGSDEAKLLLGEVSG